MLSTHAVESAADWGYSSPARSAAGTSRRRSHCITSAGGNEAGKGAGLASISASALAASARAVAAKGACGACASTRVLRLPGVKGAMGDDGVDVEGGLKLAATAAVAASAAACGDG